MPFFSIWWALLSERGSKLRRSYMLQHHCKGCMQQQAGAHHAPDDDALAAKLLDSASDKLLPCCSADQSHCNCHQPIVRPAESETWISPLMVPHTSHAAAINLQSTVQTETGHEMTFHFLKEARTALGKCRRWKPRRRSPGSCCKADASAPAHLIAAPGLQLHDPIGSG